MNKPEVLYEDNHLIVVFKPAGELTQGDASGELSLMDRVKLFIKERDKKPGNVFLGMVHRLDRPVQGAVIFAKTSKGASRLSEQFRTGKVKKIYHALVSGVMEPENGVLRDRLQKNEITRKTFFSEDGQEAVLKYGTLKKAKDISLLEIELGTGRFHQIRAQLSRAGHPIVGDKKYGSDVPLSLGEIALAEVILIFDTATDEKKVKVSINEPKEWERYIGKDK